MTPSSGLKTPASRLNTVVLPAPLGPIMPRISPSLTSKDKLKTAVTRPKFLCKFLTINISFMSLRNQKPLRSYLIRDITKKSILIGQRGFSNMIRNQFLEFLFLIIRVGESGHWCEIFCKILPKFAVHSIEFPAPLSVPGIHKLLGFGKRENHLSRYRYFRDVVIENNFHLPREPFPFNPLAGT